MKIYDYNNNIVEVSIPNKKIKAIFVHVITGDETGFIMFEDGNFLRFDSSNTRLADFNDGCYLVPENLVDEWMNWQPSRDNETYSYERQMWFYERLEN